MDYPLYICDLPPDCADEQLGALLQPSGEVKAVEWEPASGESDLRRAIVTLETGLPPRKVLDRLNRQVVGGQPVVVTPAAPPKKFGELMNQTRRRGKKVGAMLGETQPGPLSGITRIIHICGLRFALCMTRRAFELQDAGGVPVPDGSRNRTTGGLFFYLARGYLTPTLRDYLYEYHKVRTKQRREKARQAAAEAPPTQPQADLSEAPPVAEFAPEPVAVPPKPPAPKPVPLDAARQELSALREAQQTVQAQLDAIKNGEAPRTIGVFSLMKQLVDAQKAIDDLLVKHPELER